MLFKNFFKQIREIEFLYEKADKLKNKECDDNMDYSDFVESILGGNNISTVRGNVQARIGKVITQEEHDEIINRANDIIAQRKLDL